LIDLTEIFSARTIVDDIEERGFVVCHKIDDSLRGEDYPPRMPDGTRTLSDVRGMTLTIACERCGLARAP
jgi:hypothetical protein